MIIGFKTGPKNWDISKQIVLEDGARMCEVWFNVGKAEEYQEMFGWLTEQGVAIGLHHWGLVDGKIKTNLATQNEHVREESFAQMKRTIEIGREIRAVYVNVHPGAQWVEMMDFDKQEQSPIPDSATPPEKSEALLLAAVQELTAYAKSQGVLLTIETLPGREAKAYARREGIYDPRNPSLALMHKIGQRGNFMANDLTHTASMIATIDNSRESMWRELRAFTQQAAPYTKLIHANTMREPFDGRDSHDGLTAADFARGVFLSREQIIELLKIFVQQEREDAEPRTEALASSTGVYVVPEPQIETTRENFRELKKIAEEAKVA